MGVHQAIKIVQMNSTRDINISDQSYISLSQPPENQNQTDCNINTDCNIDKEITNSLESLNNTNSRNSESQTVESRIRNSKRERRPDRAVYVPRHRRLNLSTSVNSSTAQSSDNNIENDKPISVSATPSSSKTTVQRIINEAEPIQPSTKRNSQLCDIELIKDNNSTKSNNISNTIQILSSNTNNNSCKCNNSNNTSNNNNNSNIFITTTVINDRKSNENLTPIVNINSNTSSPKQTLQSFQLDPATEDFYQNRFTDIDNFKMNLTGPVKCTSFEMNDTDTKIFQPILKCQLKNDTTNSIKSHSKSQKSYDKETDDWDTLYDENGDCNDLSLSELSISVEKSPPNERQKSENDRHLRTISTDEFPHVLEVSNFPAEFKTRDLLMLFSNYKSSGFDIKWVDDTHALAIFSSSNIAAEILSMNHLFVILKPLAEATMASRIKARKSAELLQPYRQRPETCVALARRLVTGALGVKIKTSKEELENERRILRNAKEKRILAAKQRNEIWEDC